ncbi:MAG: hypothetical protein QXJ75_01075 [Candidatus Bathyarchaeia archaeon]
MDDDHAIESDLDRLGKIIPKPTNCNVSALVEDIQEAGKTSAIHGCHSWIK